MMLKKGGGIGYGGKYNIGDLSTMGSTQRDRFESFDNEMQSRDSMQMPMLSELYASNDLREEFKEEKEPYHKSFMVPSSYQEKLLSQTAHANATNLLSIADQ